MAKKEFRRLSRKDLVDIIYQMKKSEQELQAENKQLRKKIQSRRIAVSDAGSIADAALKLTDIFTVAQSSADMYLAEIEQRHADIERECSLLINKARNESKEIIRQAQEQRDAIVAQTQKAQTLLKKYKAAIRKKKTELSMYKNQE